MPRLTGETPVRSIRRFAALQRGVHCHRLVDGLVLSNSGISSSDRLAGGGFGGLGVKAATRQRADQSTRFGGFVQPGRQRGGPAAGEFQGVLLRIAVAQRCIDRERRCFLIHPSVENFALEQRSPCGTPGQFAFDDVPGQCGVVNRAERGQLIRRPSRARFIKPRPAEGLDDPGSTLRSTSEQSRRARVRFFDLFSLANALRQLRRPWLTFAKAKPIHTLRIERHDAPSADENGDPGRVALRRADRCDRRIRSVGRGRARGWLRPESRSVLVPPMTGLGTNRLAY